MRSRSKAAPVLGASVVVALLLAGCGGAGERSSDAAGVGEQTARVEAFDFGFEPTAATVSPGGTVIWTNTGKVAHTVKGPGFFSGKLEPGESYELSPVKPYTLRLRGGAIPPVHYRYHCTLHPRMRGTITVAGWR